MFITVYGSENNGKIFKSCWGRSQGIKGLLGVKTLRQQRYWMQLTLLVYFILTVIQILYKWSSWICFCAYTLKPEYCQNFPPVTSFRTGSILSRFIILLFWLNVKYLCYIIGSWAGRERVCFFSASKDLLIFKNYHLMVTHEEDFGD